MKTGNIRVLPLSSFALSALQTQRALQTRDKVAAGSLYHDMGQAFASEIGDRITPMAATCAFRRIALRAGVTTTRLHDTRHIAATYTLVSGIDVATVGALLGHSCPSTTLNRL